MVDADRIVHGLYERGGTGAAAIVELLGAEMLDPEGAVDRRRLSARLFSDAALRRRVEAAVHPLVMAEVDAWLGALPGAALPVVEAALLVESGLFRSFPFVVLVTAAPGMQRARLAERSPALAPEEIEGRLRAQMSSEAKLRLLEESGVAVELVDNSGSLEELRAASAALAERLRAAQTAYGG